MLLGAACADTTAARVVLTKHDNVRRALLAGRSDELRLGIDCPDRGESAN